MSTDSVFQLFWVGIGVVLVIDLLLYFDKIPNNAISQTIINEDGRSTLFGRLLWGVWFFLLGHWYV